jgi:hypothetical protein
VCSGPESCSQSGLVLKLIVTYERARSCPANRFFSYVDSILRRESNYNSCSILHVSTFFARCLFVQSYAIPTVAVRDVSVLFRVGGESVYCMDF